MSASQKYVPYLGKVAFRFVPCSAVSPVYSSVCVNCINTRSEMPKAHACFLRDFNWWKTASCLDATCCHCPSSYLIPAHFSWIQASWCPQMYVKMIEWPHTHSILVTSDSQRCEGSPVLGLLCASTREQAIQDNLLAEELCNTKTNHTA